MCRQLERHMRRKNILTEIDQYFQVQSGALFLDSPIVWPLTSLYFLIAVYKRVAFYFLRQINLEQSFRRGRILHMASWHQLESPVWPS